MKKADRKKPSKAIWPLLIVILFIGVYTATHRDKPVESIEIEQPSISALSTMAVGDTQTITAKILPEDAAFDSADMVLSGEGVIEIDSEMIDGNTYTASISAVGEGSTVLWIETTDSDSNKQSEEVKITVDDPEREKKEAEEAAAAEQAKKEAEEKAAAEQVQKEAEEKAAAEKAQQEAEQQAAAQQTQETASDSESGRTVYYTRTGSKYHYENPCGRGTYYPCTLAEAESRGLEPCGKCVLH